MFICELQDCSLINWCSFKGNVQIAELLITNGADVNIPNQNKETPLFWASKINNVEMVELLINSKADVNIKAEEGSILSVTTNATIKKLILTEIKSNN